MALLTDPDQLSQGTVNAVADLRFGVQTTASGTSISLDSVGANLPTVADNDYIEVRGAIDTNNNGLYRVADATPASTAIDVVKITGANPSNSGVDNTGASVLGDTTLKKNVFFDTAARDIYLIEQNGLSADGVELNAIYSFSKEEYKDDDFLRQFPFWMFAIDLDAGKYQVGTDGSNPNGWQFAADNTVDGTIRTRKLIRTGGWSHVDTAGNTAQIYAGIITLGSFEDETAGTGDLAYYHFGTDVTTDLSVDFDFTGPVNEAILCYNEIGNPDTFTYVDGAGGNDSVTRASGSWIDDGFVVGGKLVTRASTASANDGSYTILSVTALTIEVATGSFTTAGADSAAQVAFDNRDNFQIKLRVRDGDPNGKTFDSSSLTAAGVAKLNNFVFRFPLANATDLKITATDLQIDSNSDGVPDGDYLGMTITYYASAQNQTTLVGGNYDFGIIIDANGGTAQEVYEFVQWSLRSTGGNGTGDIDNDADTKIGRLMGDLLAFEGDTLVAGGQLSANPDGGGTGVYITNIAAADQNNLRLVDNTGVRRQFPETISVTLDFNAALIDDTVAEYVLYYDRTIRTSVTDFVLTAGTGPAGTISSAGTNLPNNAELSVNDYIRVAGLTGGDAAMNGVYQITAETTPGASWAVERYDGADTVSVASTTANVDQNPIDSPDAIIVQDDTPVNVQGTASADFNFAYDFDGNVQGGRVVSTDTFVVARAIGLNGAQFIQSGVQTIASGTPLTIVLTASNELNYVT
jgi:hypothetical protein